jgi:hypothetical protein
MKGRFTVGVTVQSSGGNGGDKRIPECGHVTFSALLPVLSLLQTWSTYRLRYSMQYHAMLSQLFAS